MQNVGGGGGVDVWVELAGFLGREVFVDEGRFSFLFLLIGDGGGVFGDNPLTVFDLPDRVVKVGGRGEVWMRMHLIGFDGFEGGVFVGPLKRVAGIFVKAAFEERAIEILVGATEVHAARFSVALAEGRGILVELEHLAEKHLAIVFELFWFGEEGAGLSLLLAHHELSLGGGDVFEGRLAKETR